MSSSRGRKPAPAHHQLLDSRLTAHLWSPAHFTKVIIKRDIRADAKRPDSGTQKSAKVPGNARSELESKEFFFSSFDKDKEFWGQGLGCRVPEELIFTRAITRGDASDSA